MAHRSHDLTEGAIAPTLLSFALPILGGNVLQSLNGAVNAIWVGRFLGGEALAAVANANAIMFFLLGAVFGLAMAAAILVGQASGRHDLAAARRIVGASAAFFTLSSLVIATGGLLLSPWILSWMGTPADILPFANAYLKVTLLGVPFLYLFAFLSAVLRGAGDSRTPLVFLSLVVLLDIVLVPVLLFGLGPAPALGMTGAAVASLIANAVSLFAMLVWLWRRRHPFWIDAGDARLFLPDWSVIRTLVVKGVPMGAQMVLISLAMLTMMSMVNQYGSDTAAAYAAALQLWNYVQMPAMAIGAACSSMAAQNVGARRWDRVGGTAGTGVLFNFLLTGLLILPLLLFDRQILALFLPGDALSLEIARHLNRIVLGSFLFFGVTFVISGVVRSTGAVLAPLLILVTALWGVRVPFATWLQPVLGVDAIWWSFPASALTAMLLSLAHYRWGRWRQARMLPDEPVGDAIPSEVPAAPPSPVAAPCPRAAMPASGMFRPAQRMD